MLGLPKEWLLQQLEEQLEKEQEPLSGLQKRRQGWGKRDIANKRECSTTVLGVTAWYLSCGHL